METYRPQMSPERSIYDLFKVIVGYYETGKLYYVAKMRNGFVPLVRQEVYRKFRGWRWGIKGMAWRNG